MDFVCPECGEGSHIDADFAYYIKCLFCDAIFELSTEVKVRKLAENETPPIPPVTDIDIPETVMFDGEEVSYKEYLERM